MYCSNVVVGLVVVMGLVAQGQSLHPVVGTWEMDATRSTLSGPTEQEQYSVINFAQGPGGLMIFTRSIVTSSGNPGFVQSAFRLDGEDYPIYTMGTLGPFLATATESPVTGMFQAADSNTIELVVRVGGETTARVRTFTVSSDRRTLAFRIAGTDGDDPINDVLVFDSVQ